MNRITLSLLALLMFLPLAQNAQAGFGLPKLGKRPNLPGPLGGGKKKKNKCNIEVSVNGSVVNKASQKTKECAQWAAMVADQQCAGSPGAQINVTFKGKQNGSLPRVCPGAASSADVGGSGSSGSPARRRNVRRSNARQSDDSDGDDDGSSSVSNSPRNVGPDIYDAYAASGRGPPGSGRTSFNPNGYNFNPGTPKSIPPPRDAQESDED